MPYVLPPPPEKKGTEKDKFIKWAKGKGLGVQLAADVWHWAHTYGPKGSVAAFAYYFGAVLIAESGGKHRNPDGSIKSSGQVIGVAQVALSWIDQPVPWDPGRTITRADLENPGFNLRFGAYLFGDAVAKNGFEGAYTDPGGYNPNDPNRFKAWTKIKNLLPKGLLAAPSRGPGEGTGAGKPPVAIDPWVGLKNGKAVPVNDPRLALKHFGQPVKLSDFRKWWADLNDTYLSYLGRQATASEAASILRRGITHYQITLDLVNLPEFEKKALAGKSPIFNRAGLGYQAIAADILGRDAPFGLVKKAIINNWDANTFGAHIRKTPEYLSSKEFKGLYSQYESVFRKIYGAPTDRDKNSIKEVAVRGWSAEQYAQWLRSQDRYRYSPEGQGRALAFLEQLGLIFGAQPVLREGGSPASGQVVGESPDDPRIPGRAEAPDVDNTLVAGFGG